MKGYKLALIIVILLLGINVQAQTAKVGLVGAQFLKIDVGARGMALSDAVLPLADDASACFWNPANLSLIDKGSAFLSNVSWLADIQYNALAFSWKLERFGSVGAFLSNMNTGEMEETTIELQQGTGNTFSSTGTQVGVSYSRWLTDKFSFGANLKYVFEDLASGLSGTSSDFAQGGTWAIDIGTYYITGIKSIRFGTVIKNFGPEIQLGGYYYDYELADTIKTEAQIPDPNDPTKYITVEVPEKREFRAYHLPMMFQFGIAFDPINSGNHKLTVSAVITQPNDNLQRYNLALEYWFMNILALRAGYSIGQYEKLTGFEDDGTAIYKSSYQGQDLRRLSFGAGINWKKLRLNLAMTEFDILSPVTNLSLAYNF
ncbi:MAG TPA: PorV/PorQ family protein [Candidatus Marinimicrobia bacterium]|nr:PorV/PorQ family protein [Candidatus Neomarinimicrobiota bacterium]